MRTCRLEAPCPMRVGAGCPRVGRRYSNNSACKVQNEAQLGAPPRSAPAQSRQLEVQGSQGRVSRRSISNSEFKVQNEAQLEHRHAPRGAGSVRRRSRAAVAGVEATSAIQNSQFRMKRSSSIATLDAGQAPHVDVQGSQGRATRGRVSNSEFTRCWANRAIGVPMSAQGARIARQSRPGGPRASF